MSEQSIMLCVVLAGVIIIAVVFIRRAIRHSRRMNEIIGDYGLDEEIELNAEPKDGIVRDIYLERYISGEPSHVKNRKSVYIRPAYHRRIRKIAEVIGKDKVSITDYLDRVLKAHFESHRDVINSLYDEGIEKLYSDE